MTEVYLLVIVGLITIGIVYQVLPVYIQNILERWRRSRKMYALKVTMFNGDKVYLTGGENCKNIWNNCDKVKEVTVLNDNK